MSSTTDQNENTDSINAELAPAPDVEVPCCFIEDHLPVDQSKCTESTEDYVDLETPNEQVHVEITELVPAIEPTKTVEPEILVTPKIKYQVVFFLKYSSVRPPMDDIITFFNNYGEVHHVNCPENKNIAFVFMTSLSTPVEHRRTRTTISQIIKDMPTENRFHITVASSNRGQQKQRNNRDELSETGEINRRTRIIANQPIQSVRQFRQPIPPAQSRQRISVQPKTNINTNSYNHRQGFDAYTVNNAINNGDTNFARRAVRNPINRTSVIPTVCSDKIQRAPRTHRSNDYQQPMFRANVPSYRILRRDNNNNDNQVRFEE